MPIAAISTLTSSQDFAFFEGYTPDINELSVIRADGTTWLYGHTATADDGIIVMSLSNSGVLSYESNTLAFGIPFFESYDEETPNGFSNVRVDGVTYAVSGNFLSFLGEDDSFGLHFMTVGDLGQLSPENFFEAENTRPIIAEAIKIGSDVYTFEVIADAQGRWDLLRMGEVTFGGLTQIRTGTVDLSGFRNADVFAVGDVDGDAYFFYTDSDTSEIKLVTLPGLVLVQQSTIFGSDKYGESGIATDMEVLATDDGSFLVTTNPNRGLQVYAEANIFGDFERADGVGGASDVKRFESDQVEVFSVDGRHFAVTAGADITVFEIAADGTLFKSDAIAYSDFNVALAATDLDVHVQGSNVFFLVSNAQGVQSFQFTPGLAADRDGTNGNDVLDGDVRDNRLAGLQGADSISGLDGDDSLLGGQGADVVSGGAGDDTINGGTGDDTLTGGIGRDQLSGGDGRDMILGGSGGDFIYGGGKSDVIRGGSSRDQVYGGTGRDEIYGEAGNDVLRGGSSNDTMKGGKGNDVLSAGSGSDTLIGGTGEDLLFGGSGKDVFVFGDVKKRDTIRDWEDQDRIDMRDFGNGGRFRDVDIFERSDGALRVEYENRTLIVDVNKGRLEANDLRADDFIF